MRRFITFAVLAVFVFVSSTMVTKGQNSGVPQALSAETIPCPMTLPEGDVDGETMVCGQIQVPENWDNPAGRTIVVTYAIAKAFNDAPFPDPIIYFEGGPGISALEEIEALVGYTQRLRQTRDIIFFDQRGIRYSSNLECPPEIRNREVPFEIPEGVDPAALEATLSSVSLDSDLAALLEAFRVIGPAHEDVNCAPYFAEQGIDLDQYGTYQNALDAIALMGALSYPSYNLYAISYGTTHTLEVMRYYDEHPSSALPQIRSVLIDGVIPISVDWIVNNTLGLPTIILGAFSACEQDAVCSANYPNIRQRAIDLLASVEAAPLVIDDTTTIALGDLRTVLGSAAGHADSNIYLPRLIDELERGEISVYSRLRDGTLPVPAASSPQLSNPLDSTSQEANDLASQARTLADGIEALAAQNQRLSDAYQRGLTLPEFFAEEFADAAEQITSSSRSLLSGFLRDIAIVPPDRQTLVDHVNLMPDSERDLLVSLLNLMNDEDIAQVFAILSDPLYAERLVLSFHISQTVIHCNDRVFDMNRAFEMLRGFEVPQLLDLTGIEGQFALNCEVYGLVTTDIPPLVSNTSGFPVLVVNGTLDDRTPLIWGEAVYGNLQNARMLTFPQSVHGATMDSQCAMDVTNAFFMYPDAELNAACIEGMRPVFVLPDEELPPAAE